MNQGAIPEVPLTDITAFTKRNMVQQGFGSLDDAGKSSFAGPLRFSPGVTITLIALGLALQSPILLGAMALVCLSGALFPRGMVFDVVYNVGVRHLFDGASLPPTPAPRRFSYGISTVLVTGSALSFALGSAWLGLVLGGAVVLAGAVLTTTHWCLGSRIYELVFGQAALS